MGWSTYLAPTEHRRLNELVGLLLLAGAILIALSLISFDPNDPSANISLNPRFTGKPSNFIGPVGAYVADGLFQSLGFACFLLPIFLGVYGSYWLLSRPVDNLGIRLLGIALMVATVSTSLSMSTALPRVRGHVPAGGLFGQLASRWLEESLNPTGSIVVLITAFLISLLFATTFSLTRTGNYLRTRLSFVSALTERWRERQAERARQASLKKIQQKAETPGPVAKKEQTVREIKKLDAAPAPPAPPAAPTPVAAEKTASPKIHPALAPVSRDLPPTTLLNPALDQVEMNVDELRDRARLLEAKAREFEVQGVVQQIHPGPVVTTFEFKPEAGIKYSKITGLADDLCLALEAESVRIDRIPGKSTVGIEVPNTARATIMLREILESRDFQRSNSRLTLALGKDITGQIVVSDLQKMPHLLIAGATGTGKSVSINSLILSLLYRSRPEQVRLIMIDPKRLELGLYQDIPHLLVPVVTEPKIAQNALRWAVTEMEARYKKLARRGVRTLDVYNETVKQLPIPGLGEEDNPEDREPLPYVVIVIDELADLMMTAAREVEESITRLAQMARAVGIHLILATQRPSVDVITGLIKSNFPARISFRVATKVDSRTILDSNGAEQLLGRGDMLFLPPGSSRLTRVHGPLITEEEVTRVVEFLKQQGKPVYNEKILQGPDQEKEDAELDAELDELYDEAVRLVIEMGKASTSALQRRLRVGYGRAASLLDAMERAGIIGPPDGAKPREVLVKKEEYYSDMET